MCIYINCFNKTLLYIYIYIYIYIYMYVSMKPSFVGRLKQLRVSVGNLKIKRFSVGNMKAKHLSVRDSVTLKIFCGYP